MPEEEDLTFPEPPAPAPEEFERWHCEMAARNDTRYPLDAFFYVATTLRRLLDERGREQPRKSGDDAHVTGRQLTLYLRDSLVREFAFLAPEVLAAWNISETMDFGNIIYDLVQVGLLSTSANDSRADFLNVFPIPRGLQLELEDKKIRKWPVVRP